MGFRGVIYMDMGGFNGKARELDWKSGKGGGI